MKRVKSLTYFPEQRKTEWGKYKVILGEDVYTSDSDLECFAFINFMASMGFQCSGPHFSDPLDNFFSDADTGL